MIKKYYRVEVGIPEDVWEEFRDSKEYSNKSLNAVKESIESGTDYCSKPTEWAIFNTLEKARECEKRLMDVMYYFSSKLL